MSKWRVIEGDCLKAMADMPEASVDAVVCDPPYGLEFMGKDWDRLGDGFRRRDNLADVGRDDPFGRASARGPEYVAGRRAQDWHERWATEALRVLKPGGHLLAFGGTRTYHRLACAIEDAGFEIRDTIAWLYGSGFPKSLDVSKAIDKADDSRRPEREAVGRWLREQREAAGLKQKEVAAHWPSATGGLTGCVANWEGGFNCPTLDQWADLKHIICLPDDMDAEVWRLNGRKGEPGKNWEKREIVEQRSRSGKPPQPMWDDEAGQEWDETAPATPEAQQWEGWGTALKPAWESIVWAQKPTGEADTICRSLWLLAEQLRSLASDAENASSSRPVELNEAFASAGWTADEQRNTRDALCGAMDTSQYELTLTTSLNIVSSWRSTLDALCELTSTFTTETASSTTTALRTLKCSLSDLTPRTIIQAAMNPGGSAWSALPAARAFAAVESRLSATRELLAPAPATSRCPANSRAEVVPDAESIVVARKPLTGTVAATVLEHGTGALNVGATRIAHDGRRSPNAADGTVHRPSGVVEGGWADSPGFEVSQGRWPANVVLDPEAAELLDVQSGNIVGYSGQIHRAGTRSGGYMTPHDQGAERVTTGFGDSGGASRFFYVAKASRAERNAGLDGFEPTKRADEGYGSIQTPKLDRVAPRENWQPHVTANGHPTVKPIALMRWLVRLVTPPGGTVLDPFTGSGTTGIAAVLEGFDFIGIEREAEYVAIAEARIAYWAAQPVQLELDAA